MGMCMNEEKQGENTPGKIGYLWYSPLEHIRITYRETNGIGHTVSVFTYNSSLIPNFLLVKNKLHIVQRTPTFSEQF